MEKPTQSNTVDIKLQITLDSKKTPESITWQADSSDAEGPQICKSLMVSIWDPEKENTVRFDLWTKDMMHHEMSIFIFQSLLMMADTYYKATGNKDLAGELQAFAEKFGTKANIIKPKHNEEITPFKLEL